MHNKTVFLGELTRKELGEAISSGTVQAAPPGRQGATLAVHSISGFTGGFFGPLVFGVVLDAGGGGETAMSWGFAFISLGAAVALGPLFLAVAARSVQKS